MDVGMPNTASVQIDVTDSIRAYLATELTDKGLAALNFLTVRYAVRL